MNKICPTCKESKLPSSFGNNRNAKDGKNWYCSECANKYNRDRRINVKFKDVFQKYNHRCAVCGAVKDLQIHHLGRKSEEGIEHLILLCKKCHYTTAHPGGRWNEKAKLFNCKRCGHSWYPKGPEVRICPHCKSAYWDKPRRNIA